MFCIRGTILNFNIWEWTCSSFTHIHEYDTWRKAFHVGSLDTGCLLSSVGLTHIWWEVPNKVRRGGDARIPGRCRLGGPCSRIAGSPESRYRDRRQNAPRDINSVSFTWNASTAPDAAQVMKIPTLEFRLTLEILPELCGCRCPDF